MEQVAEKILNLDVGPTQGRFLLSDARITWLISPEREGKTFACVIGLLNHREKCWPFLPTDGAGRKLSMRIAIVRDTHTNLKRHTVDSIERDFPGIFSFHDDYHKMYGYGIDADLLGMDTAADVAKIQGGQYDLIWIEEPAPIFATGNAGIRHDVFLACARRISAGGKTPKRLQISMNPASKDHWTYAESTLDPLEGTEVFHIKSGENPHISESDRRARREVYRHRPDLAARYDEGKFSDVFPGVAICSNFNEDQHMAKKVLLPSSCNQFFRFWDGGLHPAVCIAGICTATGQLFFLDSMVYEHGGMRQLIEERVLPLLAQPRYQEVAKRPRLWRDLGDATIRTPDDSDSEHNGALMIADLLKANFEPGLQRWEPRKEALLDALGRTIGPNRFVQINPKITEGEKQNWVRMGFAGGYCYDVNPSGVVMRDGPAKNVFCVDGDTEILTCAGWKRHEDLSIGEKVYGYDFEKDTLQCCRLTKINKFDGKTTTIRFRGQHIDMVVTPGHKCIANHKWSKGIRFVEASNLSTSDFLMRTSSYKRQSKKWYSDDFVSLCAWVMTEGTYRSGKSGAVTIVQSKSYNEPYCMEIDRLVNKFGGRRSKKAGNHDMISWQISGEQAELIKHTMPFKYPTPEFIHRMTNPQRRLFLYEAIRGDGTWNKGEGHLPAPIKMVRNREFFIRDKTPRLFQKNRLAVDALQIIATLCGIRASIHPKKSPYYPDGRCDGWSISFTRQGRWTGINKLEQITGETPFVWCPQTELGTWVARRNGHVFITGNSHPLDAISHGLAKLFFRAKEERPRDHDRELKRAKTYSVSGV